MDNQMGIYDGVKTNPLLLVEAACAWAKKDYGTCDCRFFRLLDLCERALKDGAPRLRRGDIFYLARDYGFDVTVCREFKFDNNLWAPLSRYLLMFRPSLAKIICPKKADIDSIDFEHVWHEAVHPNTFFYARNWQEAVKAYEAGDVSAA